VASRTRKRTPYDPSKAHDRRATESNRGIANHLTPKEVDDPFEQGAKIIVMRNLRNDPLGGMHARRTIDEAQYEAGRTYQDCFEIAQGHQQACDPSQPYVDQSFRHRGVSVTLSEAYKRLNAANKKLGQNGAALIMDVLITGLTIAQVAEKRGLGGELELKYLGKRFRECLDTLAFVYEFARHDSDERRT
jgi:GNAT superfamily N-acetyltransferase